MSATAPVPAEAGQFTWVRAWAASADPDQRFNEPLLAYRSPAPTSPWWERHDPFAEPEIFAESPRWRYRRQYSDLHAPSPFGRVRRIRVAEPDFTGLSPRRANSARTRAVVASLIQYHHLTTNQLAALGGWDPKRSDVVLAPLWAAGMLERCRMDPQNIIGGRGDTIWQLLLRSPDRTFISELPVRRWLGELSHPEWALLTLGADPFATGAGRRHLRHNLLASELMLRAHEVVDSIAATWGEALSSPHLLLPPGHPATPGHPPGWRADIGMLRQDGFRILVEVTLAGRAERAVGEKMLRWARLLSSHTHNTSGMVVVFCNADPARHDKTASTLRNCHRQYLTAERLGEPGRPALPDAVRRARSHILVASWKEWFPFAWGISDRFRRLSAAFSLDGETFRYTDLADRVQTPFEPADPTVWMDAILNFGLATHHPSWSGGPAQSLAAGPGA